MDKGINLKPSIEKDFIINNKIVSKNTRKKSLQKIQNIYKLSPNKLELFIDCKRCFYLDRKLGVRQPSGYPFLLNNAVDRLLKKEFDIYRLEQKTHPYALENNVNAIPFKHKDLKSWRTSGLKYRDPNTNVRIEGKLDDVWFNQDTDECIIVEYKATSKNGKITLGDWQKRQVEIYQWLLRKEGLKVSNTAYFVYCNGKNDLPKFDKKLDFDISLLPHEGNDSWIEGTIIEAYQCLQSCSIPPLTDTCKHCQYWKNISKHEKIQH